jgi:hypothetical protein
MQNGELKMAEQQRVDPATLNMMARSNLLQTGVPMVKQLQPVTGALGGSMQIPLQRMGILTGVTLDVSVPVTIATAALVQSMFGPYNLLNRIKYTDFSGVDRVNTSGFALWALNSIRSADLKGSAIATANLDNMGVIDTNILSFPKATGEQSINFQLYIPIAYDQHNDLRGAVLAQTTLGDHYVTLQTANALLATADGDTYMSPYDVGTTGTGTAGTVTVTAYQHYIQPQTNDPGLLPLIDLSTVYAIDGNFIDTSNIAAGMPKYLNFPNNQAVLSALFIFDNGGVGTVDGGDITKISLIANSNTIFREYSPRFLRGMMRDTIGSDLAAGTYYMGSRRQPILTQLFGNVQAKFDIASVAAAGPVQFISQYESFYPSGSPLPGIIA